jgi:hypothetical protein
MPHEVLEINNPISAIPFGPATTPFAGDVSELHAFQPSLTDLLAIGDVWVALAQGNAASDDELQRNSKCIERLSGQLLQYDSSPLATRAVSSRIEMWCW